MKAWAVIFSSLFLISIAGLIISAGVMSVSVAEVFGSGNFNIGWSSQSRGGYEVSETFNETYRNIEIGVISARTSITISPDSITRVHYRNGSNRISFTAYISGNTLVIKEQIIWSLFWDAGRMSTLDIEIPEAVYNQINLDLVSGRVNGELPETDYFELSVVSGTLDLGGLSGRGSVNIVSGTANLGYAEWNDSLKIDIVSGSTNVVVPEGSGAEINFSRVSGHVSYNLDGDSGRLDRGGSANVGGENRQRVTVDLVSGSASISN
jgi:hypothetical protein